MSRPVPTASFWHQFPVRAAASALRFVPRIPAARLEDLLPGVEDVEITLSHRSGDRALGHGEAFVLALAVARLQPERMFEIGTAGGAATLLMARQAPGARIDTLDLGNEAPSLGEQRGQPPWQDLATVGRAFQDTPEAERITQHFGDSAGSTTRRSPGRSTSCWSTARTPTSTSARTRALRCACCGRAAWWSGTTATTCRPV